MTDDDVSEDLHSDALRTEGRINEGGTLGSTAERGAAKCNRICGDHHGCQLKSDVRGSWPGYMWLCYANVYGEWRGLLTCGCYVQRSNDATNPIAARP